MARAKKGWFGEKIRHRQARLKGNATKQELFKRHKLTPKYNGTLMGNWDGDYVQYHARNINRENPEVYAYRAKGCYSDLRAIGIKGNSKRAIRRAINKEVKKGLSYTHSPSFIH